MLLKKGHYYAGAHSLHFFRKTSVHVHTHTPTNTQHNAANEKNLSNSSPAAKETVTEKALIATTLQS
jgi:hypothetical protein